MWPEVGVEAMRRPVKEAPPKRVPNERATTEEEVRVWPDGDGTRSGEAIMFALGDGVPPKPMARGAVDDALIEPPDAGGSGSGSGDGVLYAVLGAPDAGIQAAVEGVVTELVRVGKEIGRVALKIMELGVEPFELFLAPGAGHPFVQLWRKLDGLLADFAIKGMAVLKELALVAPTLAHQELTRLQGTLEGTVHISSSLNTVLRQLEGLYHQYRVLKASNAGAATTDDAAQLVQGLAVRARRVMDIISSTTFEEIDTTAHTAEVRSLIQEYARAVASNSSPRSESEEAAHVDSFIEQLIAVIRSVVGDFEISLINKINDVLLQYPHLIAIVDQSAASGSDSASTIQRVVRKWLCSKEPMKEQFPKASAVDFFDSWLDGTALVRLLNESHPGLAAALPSPPTASGLNRSTEIRLASLDAVASSELIAYLSALNNALGSLPGLPLAGFARLVHDESMPVVDAATRWSPLRAHCLTAVLMMLQVHELGPDAIKAQLDVVRHEHVHDDDDDDDAGEADGKHTNGRSAGLGSGVAADTAGASAAASRVSIGSSSTSPPR